MKLGIIIALCAVFTMGYAQDDPNPFKSIGKEVEVLTLSGGEYDEFFPADSVRRIGSVMFNVVEMKVESFVNEEVLQSESQAEGYLVSRWLSRDPLAKKFPDVSPYAFVTNSPLYAIDPNGLDTLIIHRTTGEKIGDVMHHVITFSVVQDGVETILPYRFEQATNANYVQAPSNSDVGLKFQTMASHSEETYKNTIRVQIKKPGGGYYATFMHPTSYGAQFLIGCASTCKELDEYGEPVVEPVEGENIYMTKEKASADVLNLIWQVYSYDYAIGDRNGNFAGNDFFLRTDSEVSVPLERVEPIKPDPIDSGTKSELDTRVTDIINMSGAILKAIQ